MSGIRCQNRFISADASEMRPSPVENIKTTGWDIDPINS